MSLDNNRQILPPSGQGSSSGSGSDPTKTSEPNLLTYPAEDPPSPSPPPSMPAQPQILKDRLYVGNLHPTVDEYVLAQLFSKYGKISKMDFLFHKTGPQKGKPRGYSFIEFSTQDAAINAHAALNDKLLRGRRLVVTFAHQAPQLDVSRQMKWSTDTSRPTTLSLLKGQGKPSATKDRIAALEAKLRQMEEQSSSHTSIPLHAPSLGSETDSTHTLTPTLSSAAAFKASNSDSTSALPLHPSTTLPSPLSARVLQPRHQPLTIFPSSLPSKPLVSTMPTISSDGAQRKPGVSTGPNIKANPKSSISTPYSSSSPHDRTLPSTSTSSTTTRITIPSKPLVPQRHTNSLGIIIKR